MQHDTLAAAIAEGTRFIARAKEVMRHKKHSDDGSYTYLDASPKLTGALRRTSLELTRALAEMRKP